MELDVKAANAALAAWRKQLRDTPPTYPGIGRPDWAFAEMVPRLAYRYRECTCYVYLFKRPQGIASGLVLNADWLKPQLVLGDGVDSLAAALAIATMRPAARERKEV